MSPTTPSLEELQERWPVFSTVLHNYYASKPGASRGAQGDDATFLTRFSSRGGEEDPEFSGLRNELDDMSRHPGDAAALLNLSFGYVDDDGAVDTTSPHYIDRPQARNLIVGIINDLYVSAPKGGEQDDQEEPAGIIDVRAEVFNAYWRHTLFRIPQFVPGKVPSWVRKLGGRPWAGTPVSSVAALVVGAILAAIGWGVEKGLRSLGASNAVTLPLSWPFLGTGMVLLLWAIATMLLVRSSIIRPEDDDEDDDEEQKTRAKEKARRSILRRLG